MLLHVNELIRNAVEGVPFFKDAYIAAVGGCVRDEIMRLSPTYAPFVGDTKDYDYVLSSTNIQDVGKLASLISDFYGAKDLQIFEKFGTAKMTIEGYSIELAITRRECYYEHSRKPEVVIGSLIEDSFRRDFRMNAMYYHICMKTFNPFNIYDGRQGMIDLLTGNLSTCDEPYTSFNEDPLRIMRALRFMSKYDLFMSHEAEHAIHKVINEGRLSVVSMERYRDELMKILSLSNPGHALFTLNRFGVLQYIMPEVAACFGVTQNKYHHEDVGMHCLTVLNKASKLNSDPLVRLAALLHDIGKPATRTQVGEKVQFLRHESVGVPIAQRLMSRLKFSNDDIKFVGTIIARHMDFGAEPKDGVIRKTIYKAQETLYPLLDVMEADNQSHHPDHIKVNHLTSIRERIANMDVNAIWNTEAPLTGEQIMALLNCKPGEIVGRIKNRLLEIKLKNGDISEYTAQNTARVLYNNYMNEDADAKNKS